jgi:hypothetical protein
MRLGPLFPPKRTGRTLRLGDTGATDRRCRRRPPCFSGVIEPNEDRPQLAVFGRSSYICFRPKADIWGTRFAGGFNSWVLRCVSHVTRFRLLIAEALSAEPAAMLAKHLAALDAPLKVGRRVGEGAFGHQQSEQSPIESGLPTAPTLAPRALAHSGRSCCLPPGSPPVSSGQDNAGETPGTNAAAGAFANVNQVELVCRNGPSCRLTDAAEFRLARQLARTCVACRRNSVL